MRAFIYCRVMRPGGNISALLFQQQSVQIGGFSLGSLGPVSEGLFVWIFGIGALVAITVWITAKSN